jgi:DNA-binding YbaB/EbfC family protein
MFGNLGQLAGLMKKAGQFQKDMQQVKEDLATKEYTSSVAGGKVEVTIGGDFTVRKLTISPDCLDDNELLEDMVTAAMNEAVNKARQEAAEKMAALTEGLNVPGMPDLSKMF